MSEFGSGSQEERHWDDFAPNGIEYRPNSHEICDEDDCASHPEWRIQMHDGSNCYYVWTCDDHVAEHWGYYPDRDVYVADGGERHIVEQQADQVRVKCPDGAQVTVIVADPSILNNCPICGVEVGLDGA